MGKCFLAESAKTAAAIVMESYFWKSKIVALE